MPTPNDARSDALIRQFIKERRKLQRFVDQGVLTQEQADYAQTVPLDAPDTVEPGE